LARDLFPVAVTPFHWTLLRRPAQEAMRRTWGAFGAAGGAALPVADFWRRAPDGAVYLNADLVAQAGRAVHGAAWLSAPPPDRGGLFGRWQTAGTIKRVQAQVDAAAQIALRLRQRADFQLVICHVPQPDGNNLLVSHSFCQQNSILKNKHGTARLSAQGIGIGNIVENSCLESFIFQFW